MQAGEPKNGRIPVWITQRDERITINDMMCYQCSVIQGKLTLICSIPGGLHMALPIDPSIPLEDLVFLCDRMAMVAWGIHGRFGVFGVSVLETDFDEAARLVTEE